MLSSAVMISAKVHHDTTGTRQTESDSVRKSPMALPSSSLPARVKADHSISTLSVDMSCNGSTGMARTSHASSMSVARRFARSEASDFEQQSVLSKPLDRPRVRGP